MAANNNAAPVNTGANNTTDTLVTNTSTLLHVDMANIAKLSASNYINGSKPTPDPVITIEGNTIANP
ncbi:unnamed protein product [Brassica rapa]|uniref:Uncharacterized protein n=2 Tax=Brassica TaxID=3705 RepID=A0A3P5ZSA1_BRACM|nr:unnamed protein product [Brassica napus]CAG7887375.1 unnamed protein product [Brassica rapa]VDC74888.1 unnamed protein product [Brassica rapa]